MRARAFFLALSVLAACRGAPHRPAPEAPARPNVVLIMTDDQGLGDFAHAGHPALETPNLDRLARESPSVRRFYVSPVCSPTRASLMTGRWNYRTRVVDTWIGRSMMEPDEVTIAELLRPAGYATGIFGKWHLGDCYPLRPIDQGFDQALVHRGGGIAQPSEPPANERRYTDPILFRNGEEVATEGYCTDVYFDAALDFIDASLAEGRPFFAYVATNAPHGPYHDVPEELYAKYLAKGVADREARICAMIENIDANVGRMLAHLDARGLTENTLVVFLNDNGPAGGRYVAGLRGSKAGVHEGGIRSPLFVRWPGHLDPATVIEPIAAHVDVLPTILEAVGVPAPADLHLDGRSLLPLLAGAEPPWPERRIFLQSHRGDVPAFEHHFAVIGQRWKLVRASGFGRHEPEADHPFELYDLIEDPGESNDLAAELPHVVAELREAYARWFADVSGTRPDNYAPPRIVIGDTAETRTVLTRQDWRTAEGQGWGDGGAWLLEARAPTELEVTVLFHEPQTVDRVRLHAGAAVAERGLEHAGKTLSLGVLPLPAGAFELRVECEHEGAPVPVHQVVLQQVKRLDG
ncbi:MAG: arylsulfatase [Planctomycetota bacterium]|nr:arylsulfatase [Planctomycetota bacterium]